jgi:hypothetical protein
VTNTVKVKRIFVPPKAPPPPTMWQTIKNEHLLVATFCAADANYAAVQKGASQLREAQLVQVVFNTSVFQLALLCLFGWRFTPFDTPLGAGLVVAAATLSAFFAALLTLLGKAVFRWGNIKRRKLRKVGRLRRFYRWCKGWIVKKKDDDLKLVQRFQEAVMREWWHHRTAGMRRTPKKALPRMVAVVRMNLAWCLNSSVFLASMILALVYGITFEAAKYHSVLVGWLVSLIETWLLVEPSVVFTIFILPKLIDKAMTPLDPAEAKRRRRLKRKRKEALASRFSFGGLSGRASRKYAA